VDKSDVFATRREDIRLTNAERIRRGLPLNRPHVRLGSQTISMSTLISDLAVDVETLLAARDSIASPVPKYAIIGVYKDAAFTNLVGYLSATTTGTTTYPFPVTTVSTPLFFIESANVVVGHEQRKRFYPAKPGPIYRKYC
jgi:hypothetical protein